MNLNNCPISRALFGAAGIPSQPTCNQAGCNYPEAECTEQCKPLHHQRVYAYEPPSLEPLQERLKRWARKVLNWFITLLAFCVFVGPTCLMIWSEAKTQEELVTAKGLAYAKGYCAAQARAGVEQEEFCRRIK